MREAIRLFREAGGTITPIAKSGEHRFSHPRLPRPLIIGGRKKDAPSVLVYALRRVIDFSPS